MQRIVIELKILRNALDATIEKGLQQTADYADKMGASEAHLVIFNRDPKTSWDDKIWQQELEYQRRVIGVWGC